MSQNYSDPQFEQYRRGRKRWGGQSRPVDPEELSGKSAVLKQLERAEAEEIRDEQLSREVHEFFSTATRTAADIVAKVSETQETAVVENVSTQMEDFLRDAIGRVQSLMMQIRMQPGADQIASQDIEANIQNIVGAQLDGFRYEGTAQLDDKHIGQNPFEDDLGIEEVSLPAEDAGEVDAVAARPAPERTPQQSPSSALDDVPCTTLENWVQSLVDDPKKLAATLKVLVAGAVMPKEEALEIFHEVTGAITNEDG